MWSWEQNKERCRRTKMAAGKVKWFNDAKGFGFIVREGGPDLFVHHTAIVADGFRSLAEGQEGEFDITEGPKGLPAANVRPAGRLVAPRRSRGVRRLFVQVAAIPRFARGRSSRSAPQARCATIVVSGS